MTTLSEILGKDVIGMRDGCRLGRVCDAEIDIECADICSIIIYGRLRFFGLLGRYDDIIIPWKDIKVIGDDAILVEASCDMFCNRRKPFFKGLFRNR